MKKVLNIYKPVGITPLQLVNRLHVSNPEYKNEKIGYAGRLDPMAHGVMLLLVGDETRNREKYQNLDKEYEFEVLFGFSTDTYDLLGLVSGQNMINYEKKELEKRLNDFVKKHPEEFDQEYPPYSSKTVKGKPLYWWARKNKLSEIKIPAKKVRIYDFKPISIDSVSKKNLKRLITERVGLVSGDFRQYQILKSWEKALQNASDDHFSTAKFHIHCSSGTYIRNITNCIGKFLNIKLTTLNILRNKVGKYTLNNSLKI